MQTPPLSEKETRLELFAGIHPQNQQPVFEQCLATPTETEHQYRLLKSPMFVRGVAARDIVKIVPESRGRFSLVERGGNLCVRVFLREPDSALEEALTGELEKLGGHLDIASERALVYSIHFGIGFQTLEKLLDTHLPKGSARWLYGNVYDDEGQPLNWWQSMMQV
ncbi:MAG: DUF4265 domain-containing protein [Spongiibacter sp.]|uniref:DUF4265 domain-containing protein n=1 Tax=Spongiibacter thalassae TaxID=2721624 RepID=A0ABX1GG90_9GAMM|nr:DUF4265 domain-containing protein [Spongiibacter thalassae]MDX1504119.1 DUF4265 domain-containing protein [Spongiibacter sp.]NKI18224.1 DUF4265 domain-containing protein [Spongiibacter thalassae]